MKNNFVDVNEMDIHPEVAFFIPEKLARRFKAICFGIKDRNIDVVMAEPDNIFAQDELHVGTGFEINPFPGDPDAIEKVLDRIYSEYETWTGPVRLMELIEKRRAYRSLQPVEINEGIINELAGAARLAPSCFNNQPWRYVFVYESEMLNKMHEALSKGNEWAKNASMIIAVFSKPELDCQQKEKSFFMFDTGMATAFIILKATEMGMVAHPIAGFNSKKTREILEIPDDMTVITLVIVGKHSKTMSALMSDKQKEAEKTRPERLELGEFVFMNKY